MLKRVALSVRVRLTAISKIVLTAAIQSLELNGVRKFVHSTSILLGMRITTYVLSIRELATLILGMNGRIILKVALNVGCEVVVWIIWFKVYGAVTCCFKH